MNAELLYEALSDGNSLEELSEHDLKRLVSAHPYFSIGQLLLAKKYKASDNKESYQEQREHLQAFYRNPWWLYYQLELSNHSAHNQYAYGHTPTYQPSPSIGADHTDVTTPLFEDESGHEDAEEFRGDAQPVEAWAVRGDTQAVEGGTDHEDAQPVESETEIETAVESDIEDQPVEVEPTNNIETEAEPLTGTEPISSEHPIGVAFMPELEDSFGEGESFVPEQAPTPPFANPHHRHGFVPWPGMEDTEDIPTLMGGTAPVQAVPADQAVPTVQAAATDATVGDKSDSGMPQPYLPYMVTATVETEKPTQAISSKAAEKAAREAAYLSEPEELPLEDIDQEAELQPSEQVPLIKDEVLPEPPPAFPSGEPAPFPFSMTPLAHDFAFEPLHTVDYFASQGIKLDLDENPTDNLTRHLKSFTEWLKTMKRISPLDRQEDLDAATEAEIQLLASSANHQREAVLTESMAHVWVLQGKINKAIEVYNKLSLQHPEKRAYFASKIDHLNRL